MRDSTVHIVKIMRIVIKFHPLLTIANLIFQLIFLKDWIEEEVSNQWKALKVHCQSTMTTLLDLLIEKTKSLSEALQIHLDKEAAKGHLKAKLIGRFALFSATFLLLKTELSLKYDKRGLKTQLLLITGLDLLSPLRDWSQLQFLRGRCGCVANLTSNFTSFILALFFAKSYDNSLRTLSFVFCIAIYFLCLLLVLRPRTDFGLFSFIIGVIGSIAYNYFEFKFFTWIIVSICLMLLSFKSWLDKYWLDLEKEQSLPSANTIAGGSSAILILSSGALRIVGTMFVSHLDKSSVFDYKVLLAKVIITALWNVRLSKRSLPSTNTKQITGLILIVVSVAQGMFLIALTICSVADYRDWLFAGIGFVVFCFWLHSFFPKDLLPPSSSTNTKGITGMILSSLFVAKYGIVVLAGVEPHLYRDWLVPVIFYVLWWVLLGMPFPKHLFLYIPVEFNASEWWTLVVLTATSDYFLYLFGQTV